MAPFKTNQKLSGGQTSNGGTRRKILTMEYTYKKSPVTKGPQQPHKPHSSPADQFKLNVAQSTNAMSPQSVRRPVAPPAYRPQLKQNAAQLKTFAQKHPTRQPIYRPQPLPKVLQKTEANTEHLPINRPEQKVVAPPAYRSQSVPKVLQTKTAQVRPPVVQAKLAAAPGPNRSGNQSCAVQPRLKSEAGAKKSPVAPPVYRPQQAPKVLQTKSASKKTPSASHGRRHALAPSIHHQTIQRMERIPGLPGFYEGQLPQPNRGGTFNTVWSQTEPTEEGNSTMSHSSV